LERDGGFLILYAPHWGGSKNRNPPKFTKSSVYYRPIVSATCLN